MDLSEKLRRKTDPIWRKILGHPFVLGIGDGTLSADKFRFYLRQDYLFLVDYSRLLALAVAKAPDLASMGRFAGLLDATLNREMSMHRDLAARLGVGPDDLGRASAAPTTYAYTRHLLEVAASGGLHEITAALLPCQWSYADIGSALARTTASNPHPFYRQWIEMYASEDFAALVGWLRALLDGARGRADEDRLETIFATSARYEYLFWEMAHRMEQWPI